MHNDEYARATETLRGAAMLMKNFVYTAVSWAFLTLSVAGHNDAAAQDPKDSGELHDPAFPVPSSIDAEHKKLHEMLARVNKSGGKTADAGKEVEKLLQRHFAKEAQFALPPLGLLPGLADGRVPSNSAEVINITDRLKAEMPAMLAEHKKIVEALQRLREVAQKERKKEAVQFADDLSAHATQEEQILYPSAILVGEYLKLKSK